MRVLGAILAGGQSRRFGSDKAEALLDGRPLIEHVADALRRDCEALVVCGRAHPGFDCVTDLPQPGLGPLGGLCAALARGKAAGFDAVLSAPCDVPGLPAGLPSQLAQGARAAYVAELPVLGLWPCDLADTLLHHLAGQADRSMRGWACTVDAVPITLANILANINTPADLDAYCCKTQPPWIT